MNERPLAAAPGRQPFPGAAQPAITQRPGVAIPPAAPRPRPVAVGPATATLHTAPRPVHARDDARRRLPGLKRRIVLASVVAFAGVLGLAASNAVGVSGHATAAGTGAVAAGTTGQPAAGTSQNGTTSQSPSFFDPAAGGGNPGLVGGSSQTPVFQSSGS